MAPAIPSMGVPFFASILGKIQAQPENVPIFWGTLLVGGGPKRKQTENLSHVLGVGGAAWYPSKTQHEEAAQVIFKPTHLRKPGNRRFFSKHSPRPYFAVGITEAQVIRGKLGQVMSSSPEVMTVELGSMHSAIELLECGLEQRTWKYKVHL